MTNEIAYPRVIKSITEAVSRIYSGGSVRFNDLSELGFRGLAANEIFSRRDFWRGAEKVLVLVDEPGDFTEQCRLKKYPIDLAGEIKAFCRADRDGWNKILEIGRKLDENMSGRRSGSNQQLGLIIVDNLRSVKNIDFDAMTTFGWLIKEAKGEGRGRRGNLSILVFDDNIMDIEGSNGRRELDTTLTRWRSSFFGEMSIRQKAIFE